MLGKKSTAVAALFFAMHAPSILAQPAPETVEIEMSSFKFSPASIHLVHGRDYVLHFVNRASGGHNFSAPAFFKAAKVAPADNARLTRGGVNLGGGEDARIRLTAPPAGHYDVRCTHFMHSAFGMSGEIVVV